MVQILGFAILPVEAWPLLDLADLYGRWWVAFDLSLLLALFIAVAAATVGRQLGGREGQLASIAAGTALALAGLGLELSLGVNLTALGGLAAFVLVLSATTAIFRALRSTGLDPGVALAITIIVLGVGSAVITPEGVLVLGVAILQLAGIVAIFFLGFRVASALRAGRAGRLGRLAQEIEKPHAERAPRTHTLLRSAPDPDRRAQQSALADELQRVTRRQEKDSTQIIRELNLIQEVVERDALSAGDRVAISAALRRVTPERRQLASDVDRVRRLNRALKRFDLEACRQLRNRARGLSQQDRQRLARSIANARWKMGVEAEIEQAEHFVVDHDAFMAKALVRAAQEVSHGRLAEARAWLNSALEYESKALRTVEGLQAMEQKLLESVRAELDPNAGP